MRAILNEVRDQRMISYGVNAEYIVVFCYVFLEIFYPTFTIHVYLPFTIYSLPDYNIEFSPIIETGKGRGGGS